MRNCNNLYVMLVYTRKLTLAKSFNSVFINIVIKVVITFTTKTNIGSLMNSKKMTLLSYSHYDAYIFSIKLDRQTIECAT